MELPYNSIQEDLTALIDEEKMKAKGLSERDRKVYKKAVKACKSVLSNHRKMANIKEVI